MNQNKISDAEWKIMNIVWSYKDNIINAKEIVDEMKELENWNKNTTYTVINRLISKGLIERQEPNFQCIPMVNREEVTYSETVTFLDKVYNGSLKMLVSNFLSKEKLTRKEIDEIKELIEAKGKSK